MYTQLLGAALGEVAVNRGLTTDEALANVRRLRMVRPRPSAGGEGGVAVAVAEELTYDVALIDLAGRFGIECDLRAFDEPERGRAHLESAIEGRGVDLSAPDPGRGHDGGGPEDPSGRHPDAPRTGPGGAGR